MNQTGGDMVDVCNEAFLLPKTICQIIVEVDSELCLALFTKTLVVSSNNRKESGGTCDQAIQYIFTYNVFIFGECFRSTVCIDGTGVNMSYTEYHKMEHVCT